MGSNYYSDWVMFNDYYSHEIKRIGHLNNVNYSSPYIKYLKEKRLRNNMKILNFDINKIIKNGCNENDWNKRRYIPKN